MKLVRLSVKRFQCIESADVEFGPHLNVLYGPNDLGKSSLAWAIRAVLLIPHGSVHAQQFASWYDDAEPRVALTFCDDDGRFWRVTKTFGGAGAGRSTLESSKDGRSFVAEAQARDVDRRVRELLRWGLAAPGTQGRQPIPESFLTQVLLAEQSQASVRKVLVDASLEDDPDESGRVRMNQALGALAQDPLFKQVLDQTMDWVDKAFTPKGTRKRSAGSPWVEVADRISALQDEKDDLEQKVKDSEGVEQKIREIHKNRDLLAAKVAADAEQVADARRALELTLQRGKLELAIKEQEARLTSVRSVANELALLDRDLAALADVVIAARTYADQTGRAAASAEAELSAARAMLDTALLDDAATQRERVLVAAKGTADDGLRDARGAVDAAREAVQQAQRAIAQRDRERDEFEKRRATAAAAEATASSATADVERAQRALDGAREQRRILRSDDRVQARALRRQELENRRLSMEARDVELTAALGRAQAVGRQLQEVSKAQATVQGAVGELSAARSAVVAAEAGMAKLVVARQELAQLEAYGRSREVRAQLSAAAQAGEAVAQERARAQELHMRAEALRADLRPGLPSAERVAALRALRDELRIAEARLGGGVSVTVRPKRTISIAATRDGVAEQSVDAAASQVHAFGATRLLTLAISDVADIEIVAGEDAARRTVTDLRARWLREGEATLIEHQVPTLDELAAARARADSAETKLADCLRDATLAEHRAAGMVTTDEGLLRAQLEAIDVELTGADREDLAIRLAKLGEPWQPGLRRRSAELDDEVARQTSLLELKRAAVARCEAQLEGLQARARELEEAAAAAQRELVDPWATVVATTTAERADLQAALREVDQGLAATSAGASDEEATSAQSVATATAAFEAARSFAAKAQKDAQSAGIALAQATARLEAVETEARELDPERAAAQCNAAEDALEAARAAATTAQAALDEHRAQRDRHVAALRGRAVEAEAAHRGARERATAAAGEAVACETDQRKKIDHRGELRVMAASVNPDDIRRTIAGLRAQVDALGPSSPVDERDVERRERLLVDARNLLRDTDAELERNRGALEHVGGAIVRERLAEVSAALDRAAERQREVEIEYDGWRLLQDALREAEQTESRHLGRSLAGPVSSRFRALTGGRYGDLELGPQLEAGGVQVAGEVRELAALSAGTQDQLATLLRICIAQQLKSTIVLDDHLSQSDTGRIAWFNAMLREASEQVQIVLITCRPDELLTAVDQPDRVHSTDLSKAITRYASVRKTIM